MHFIYSIVKRVLSISYTHAAKHNNDFCLLRVCSREPTATVLFNFEMHKEKRQTITSMRESRAEKQDEYFFIITDPVGFCFSWKTSPGDRPDSPFYLTVQADNII